MREVNVSLTYSGAYAVSELTRGWTDEEIAKLNSSDAEAVDALRESAAEMVLQHPGDSEMLFYIDGEDA